MKYEYNSINIIAEFHTLNQGDDPAQRMMCTFFAPAINLKYNCGIDLNEMDIEKIALKQFDAGKFDYAEGGYGLDGVEAVYNYVVDNAKARGWKVPNLLTFYNEDEDELLDFIDRGYAAIVGIGVGPEFYADSADGKIEKFEDYYNYKGNRGHFTDVFKWIARGGESSDNGKESILDSYAFNKKGRENIYKCNLKEVFEDLAMRSKYIFMP